MHISVRLPKLDPTLLPPPTHCPLKNRQTKRRCTGKHFKLHQVHAVKPLRDLKHTQVPCQRYRCLKCNRTFRVYPPGISRDQFSATLKALTVLLYVLGLSYQGVADLCESLLQPVSKTAVYNHVQAAGQRVQRLRKQWLAQQRGNLKVLGLDCTHVKVSGRDTIVAVATAILTGQPLTFDILDAEGSVRIERWIRDLADEIGAEIVVTDDADALKRVADALGCQHQICRAHVNRNVHDLVAQLGTKALNHPDRVPGELPGLSFDQFLEDVQDLEWIIKSLLASYPTHHDRASATRHPRRTLSNGTAPRPRSARQHVVSHAHVNLGLEREL